MEYDAGENLFGQVALARDYIDRSQLDECLAEQSRSLRRKSIGLLMLEKKYLTEEQVDEILGIQSQQRRQAQLKEKEEVESSLFGNLVVSRGYVNEGDLASCLEDQRAFAEKGYSFRLGELLVARGFLAAEQVKEVLRIQNKSILVCPECYLTYNIDLFQSQREFPCTSCGATLSTAFRIRSTSPTR